MPFPSPRVIRVITLNVALAVSGQQGLHQRVEVLSPLSARRGCEQEGWFVEGRRKGRARRETRREFCFRWVLF
jgi:hypothetical protein